MAEIRWGILSTARIGRRAVAPAIRASKNGHLYAVASRSEERARSYADELGINKVYGSYEMLLADPNVDAVYVPLPNALHKKWVIRSAEAGKHVLCEKPLALNASEVAEMQSAASKNGVKLMEAFMYRFHPRSEEAFKISKSGLLGELHFVRSVFSFQLRATDDIRRDPELGGGALMDVGCYCVNVTRTLIGCEPISVQMFARMGSTGVDEELYATLSFPGGKYAQFHSALCLPRLEEVLVVGDMARMFWPSAFLPGENAVELNLTTQNGEERKQFTGVDEYRLMVEHFADCVLEDRQPRWSVEDAAANMTVINALYKSAQEGGQSVEITQ